MNANGPNGFMLSATLHGIVVAFLLLWSYAESQNSKPPEKILELVAGDGSNFAAPAAPGQTGGARATPPTQRTIAQSLKRQLIVADSKAKIAVQKERGAEEKRLAQLEAEQKKQAKLADTPPSPKTPTPSKVTKIDTDDLVKGIVGGDPNVKEGAGGNALRRGEGSDMELYFAMLKQRLLQALDKPTGVSDTLIAGAEFRISADGSITGVRIIKKSGSPEFDRAVLDAFAHTHMPARTDGRSDTHTLEFRTRDAQEH